MSEEEKTPSAETLHCPGCLEPVRANRLNKYVTHAMNLDGSRHRCPPTIAQILVIHGNKGANDVLYALGSNGRAYHLYAEYDGNGRLARTLWAPLPKLPPDEV